VPALVLVGAIVLAAVYASAGIADTTIPAPGWTVTVTPSTNLTDGQRITVNVRSNSDVAVNSVDIRECRLGVTYDSEDDMNPDSKHCPPRPVSSSADYIVSRSASLGLTALARTSAGATIPYFVGAGAVAWNDDAGTTLTCDQSNPCALVMKFGIGADTVFKSVKLEFTDGNPIAACGGAADGIVNSAGPDEVSDLWASWTRDICAKTGTKAPSRTAFTGEGSAVTQFANGEVDLAYTAAGYDADVGLLSDGATGTRNAVAIPLALNASVFGSGGGQHQLVNNLPLGDKAPYPDGSVSLDASEVASFLTGGIPWISRFDKPWSNDITNRNPALQFILYASDGSVTAPSETLASTYYMTKYLHELAPDEFTIPNTTTARQVTSSLALSNPAYENLGLYTGRPSLAKVVIPASLSVTDGPTWAMTDLATARVYGITPAAIEGSGGFVFPDAASMAAAVPLMTQNSQGILVPDPGAIAGAGAGAGVTATATAPYPLTYVEYALVPAEPLVDENTCTLRSNSQQLLTAYLEYVTSDGQKNLPAGMQPLPDSLAEQAKTRLASVGASVVTGPCAGKVGPPVTGAPSPTGTAGGGGATSPSSFGNTSPSTFGAGLTNPNAAAAAAAGGAVGEKKEAVVAIPAFAGHKIASPWGGILALIGIVVTMSLGAWITAGGELGGHAPDGQVGQLTPRRIGSLALLWGGVTLVGVALVMFQLGPTLQQRDQRDLLSQYRAEVKHAAAESQTLTGVTTDDRAPEIGDPVGILEIGSLKVQNVVVEGVSASQTSVGPGHVPGTAGLGQPGNSVVVARRNGYGGPFADLGAVRRGDRIVATTTQGQSVYRVNDVRTVTVDDDSASDQSTPTTTTASPTTTTTTTTAATATTTATTSTTSGTGNAANAASSTPVRDVSYGKTTTKASKDVTVKASALYGKTKANQLTLVTSASRSPLNSSQATEVVATMIGDPFEYTTQGAHSSSQTGLHGDQGALSAVFLALLALAAVVVASVVLYRRMRFRIAYVLTIAPLVALTVIFGESLIKLLPAWS
jgi:LPXTG-site transpeptidase (sortase) family protein